MIPSKLKPWLLVSVLCLLPGLASATLYQVEVILFKNNQPQATENWLSYPPLPATENAKLLQQPSPGNQNQAYYLLPENRLKLRREAQTISNNPDYTLLTHQAWLQPLSSRNQLVALNIQPSQYTLSSMGYGRDNWHLQGVIRLSQQNYINFASDLLLTFANNEIPIRHQRRLRMDELYYLDNPLFGMLVKVTPVG